MSALKKIRFLLVRWKGRIKQLTTLNTVESPRGWFLETKFRNFKSFTNRRPSLGNGLGANKLPEKQLPSNLSVQPFTTEKCNSQVTGNPYVHCSGQFPCKKSSLGNQPPHFMGPSFFDFLDHCLRLGSLEAESEMGRVIWGDVLSGELCMGMGEAGEADEGAEQKCMLSDEGHSLIPWKLCSVNFTLGSVLP